MKFEYKLGSEDNEIELNVVVGTPVAASTLVYLCKSGSKKKLLTESTLSNANIEHRVIGRSSGLAGAYLVIHTLFHLAIIEPSKWEETADKISIQYSLNGGLSGFTHFEYDDDNKFINKNNSFVYVITPVKMI